MNDTPVVILAGGYGTRLSEYTSKIPKPLVKANNKPLIWYIMTHYSKYGFNNFIICLGYKGKYIKDYFDKLFLNEKFKKKAKWKVKLINTGLNSLTGTRIKKIQKEIKTDYFLLTYGDGISKINFKKLIQYHLKSKKIITFTAVRPPARFGELKLKNNKVIDFNEKPQLNQGWINGGFFVMNYKIFKFLGKKNSMLEREPMQKLLKSKNINAYKHKKFWMCMDTLRDKINLEKIIKKKMNLRNK